MGRLILFYSFFPGRAHAIRVLAYFSVTEILFSRLAQIRRAGKKFRIVWKLSWTNENIFGAARAFHSQWIPRGSWARQIFRVLYTSDSASIKYFAKWLIIPGGLATRPRWLIYVIYKYIYEYIRIFNILVAHRTLLTTFPFRWRNRVISTKRNDFKICEINRSNLNYLRV